MTVDGVVAMERRARWCLMVNVGEAVLLGVGVDACMLIARCLAT